MIGKTLICVCVALAMLSAFACVTSAKTIYVPDDYARIGDAVNAASPGDTIIVRDGTYTENVDVNKQLTIKSENGSAYCIVQAANPEDPYDPVFEVTAHSVNIEGLTVQGTADYYDPPGPPVGIYLKNMGNCNISGNNISNNRYGVSLSDSDGNNIAGNNICSNYWGGIALGRYSHWNNIAGNNILNNYDGICIGYYSNNNEISGNNISNNNGYGLHLGSDSNISGNNISNNNGYGIYLGYRSENNGISGNSISNNNDGGIYLYGSENNEISGNNISNNNGDGIKLRDSRNNIISVIHSQMMVFSFVNHPFGNGIKITYITTQLTESRLYTLKKNLIK